MTLVVGATACGSAATSPAPTMDGSTTTIGVVPLGWLDDAGVMTCTKIPYRGANIYNSTATVNGSDGTCVGSIPASFSWKTGDPGTPCNGPLDCAPVCCACVGGASAAATSWCTPAGVCAIPVDACCALVGVFSNSCGNCMPGPNCGNK